MTQRLYLTVYAPDALPTTAGEVTSLSLGTVNKASELEAKVHLHGTGSGRVKISRYHTQAALLQADRYVLVHSDAGVVAGFFLEEGPIDLSSEDGKGGEFIEWKGRGPISILERGNMDADSNITGGHDPIDGYWDLDSQGGFAGASNAHPIAMYKRVLVEMQLNSPSGIDVVDHSSWTYDTDSASASVPFLDGEAQGAQVGDDGLVLLQRMDQLGGVVFVMSPLFKLDAYLTYGTDRTGGSFGSGVVRFEKGVNIAASLQRKVRGSVTRTHLIVEGQDRTYVTVTDPAYMSGDVVRWGYLSVPETSNTDQLEAAGLAHIALRKRQTDAWSFPQHDHGDNEANGIYEPAPAGNYWIGDTATLHSGSGQYDANEEPVPIASITWALKTGEEANGDYWVVLEVGSTFKWDPRSQEAFAAMTSPPEGPRLLLCRDPVAAGADVTRYYFDGNVTGLPTVAIDDSWDYGNAAFGMSWFTGHLNPAGGTSASTSWGTGSGQALTNHLHSQHMIALSGSGTFGGKVRGMIQARRKTGVGVQSTQQHQTQIVIRIVSHDGLTVRGTLLAAHEPGALDSTKFGSTYSSKWVPPVSGVWDGSGLGADLTPVDYVDGDYLVVEIGDRNILAVTGPGANITWPGTASEDLGEAEGETASRRPWIEFAISGGDARAGCLPYDTVLQGHETMGPADGDPCNQRAAPCHHQHAHGLLGALGLNYHDITQLSGFVVHGSGAPTADDDETVTTVLIRAGTHWIDDDTGALYFCLDATAGAAAWVQLAGTVSSSGSGLYVPSGSANLVPPRVKPSRSGQITQGARFDVETGAGYKSFPAAVVAEGIIHLLYRNGTVHIGSPNDGKLEYRQYVLNEDGQLDQIYSATIHDPTYDARDPWMVYLPSIRRLVVGWHESTGTVSTRTLWTMYSDPDESDAIGHSWSTPTQITDHGMNNSPAMTKAVLVGSTIVAGVFGMKDSGDTKWSVGIVRSIDNGETWGNPVIVLDGESLGRKYHELVLGNLSDGRLMGLVRSDDTDHSYQIFGDPNDLTSWSSPVDVLTLTGRPDWIEFFPQAIAVWGRNNDTDFDSRYATTWDACATFTSPAETDTGSTENQEYAVPLLLGPGTVLTFYGLEASSTAAHIYARIYTDGLGFTTAGGLEAATLAVGGVEIDPTGGSEGDVLTQQPDGSFAPAASTGGAAGHYEVLIAAESDPAEPLENGDGDWLYVWVPD